MKKFVRIKFVMMLAVCMLSAASIFCAGRNTLSAHAYTDDEIAAAKEWLAANGYSPSRAGAEQAYQDYLNGKFGPIQGADTPPADNTPPADDESQEAGKENAGENPAGAAGEEQPNGETGTDTEQPDGGNAADAGQQTDAPAEPKAGKNTAADTKKSADSSADAGKKAADPAADTKKKEAADTVTAKNNDESSTGSQNKAAAKDKEQLNPSTEDKTDSAEAAASPKDIAAVTETTDTDAAGAAAAAVIGVPAEKTGISYTVILCAVVAAAAAAVCLIIYLRRKNERTAS